MFPDPPPQLPTIWDSSTRTDFIHKYKDWTAKHGYYSVVPTDRTQIYNRTRQEIASMLPPNDTRMYLRTSTQPVPPGYVRPTRPQKLLRTDSKDGAVVNEHPPGAVHSTSKNVSVQQPTPSDNVQTNVQGHLHHLHGVPPPHPLR